MKYYFIKSVNLPYGREWDIYNNWISTNKNLLIEKVRKDLEEEVLFEPITIRLKEDCLLINDSKEEWLFICELEAV